MCLPHKASEYLFAQRSCYFFSFQEERGTCVHCMIKLKFKPSIFMHALITILLYKWSFAINIVLVVFLEHHIISSSGTVVKFTLNFDQSLSLCSSNTTIAKSFKSNYMKQSSTTDQHEFMASIPVEGVDMFQEVLQKRRWCSCQYDCRHCL